MNQVTLIGNLGSDPELIETRNGKELCKFSLATNDGWGDNEKTNWHRIVVFGKQAGPCAQYLAKGRKAAVTGRVEYGSYENKEGQTVYTTDIIAERVEFLGGDGGGSSANGNGRERRKPPQTEAAFDQSFNDDDIPF